MSTTHALGWMLAAVAGLFVTDQWSAGDAGGIAGIEQIPEPAPALKPTLASDMTHRSDAASQQDPRQDPPKRPEPQNPSPGSETAAPVQTVKLQTATFALG